MTETKKRIEWIDFARGAGIILVFIAFTIAVLYIFNEIIIRTPLCVIIGKKKKKLDN